MMSSALSQTSMSLREKISRAAEIFVDIKVQNLPLQFYLSTLDGLGDLFEDEIIPTPVPLRIQLENLALHLVEDRPSKNITSPGSLPIDVAIPSLLVTRDRSGLFSIQHSTVEPSEPMSNAHASVPEVLKPSAQASCKSSSASSAMAHHLDLGKSKSKYTAAHIILDGEVVKSLQRRIFKLFELCFFWDIFA